MSWLHYDRLSKRLALIRVLRGRRFTLHTAPIEAGIRIGAAYTVRKA